jgi:hypothetical protein
MTSELNIDVYYHRLQAVAKELKVKGDVRNVREFPFKVFTEDGSPGKRRTFGHHLECG